MPPATQSCIYIGTCSDDIKNCHDDACEEGVDCGGPCDPCAEVQMPIPIDAQAKITPLLIITTISAALLILLYGYFHKQINASVAKLGWKLAGQIIKPILLADKEKKIIMEMLLALEKRLKKAKKLKESRMIISSIMRYFYKKLMDLPSAFKMDEFNVKIKRLKYPETLNRILTSFAEKIIDLESGKLPLNQLEIENMIEESRVLVYLTSRFVKEDIGKEIAEKKIETTGVSKIEKTRLMIYNTYIAMLFNEVEICKKKYIEIINIYDDLHPDKKKKIYEDFARLFDEIKYVISWKI